MSLVAICHVMFHTAPAYAPSKAVLAALRRLSLGHYALRLIPSLPYAIGYRLYAVLYRVGQVLHRQDLILVNLSDFANFIKRKVYQKPYDSKERRKPDDFNGIKIFDS